MSVQVANSLSHGKRKFELENRSGKPKQRKCVHFDPVPQLLSPDWMQIFRNVEIARNIVSFLGAAGRSAKSSNGRRRLPSDPDVSNVTEIEQNSLLGLNLCNTWMASQVPVWFRRIRIRLGNNEEQIPPHCLRKIISRHSAHATELRIVGIETQKILTQWGKGKSASEESLTKEGTVPAVAWRDIASFTHLQKLGISGRLNMLQNERNHENTQKIQSLEFRYCTRDMLENYIAFLEKLKGGLGVREITFVGVEFDNGMIAKLSTVQPGVEKLGFRFFHIRSSSEEMTQTLIVENGSEPSYRAKKNKTVPALANFKNLSELTWSRSQPSEVDESIQKLKGLVRLNLSRNSLRCLSQRLPECTNLLELDLCDNQLTKLPDSVGRLESLKLLRVARNQLSELPESIGNLSNLVELNARVNKLTTLPVGIKGLTHLKKLRLEMNNMRALPESIGDLRSLELLQLGGNQLKSLPASICALANLVALHAPKNQLLSLPQKVGELRSLRFLFLEHNNLEELPKSFGKLESLVWFGVGSNLIRRLPEEFSNLRNLRVFSAQCNKLERLPSTMGDLRSLDSLRLDNNELIELPNSVGQLSSLMVLTANGNFLKELPASISDMVSLEVLSLFHNKFCKPIPVALISLPSLRQLGIDHAGTKPVVFSRYETRAL